MFLHIVEAHGRDVAEGSKEIGVDGESERFVEHDISLVSNEPSGRKLDPFMRYARPVVLTAVRVHCLRGIGSGFSTRR